MAGQVFAVTGGKGGVGKSTTTVNLGVSLRLDGYSVALIDADVEMPNLLELLSVKPSKNIHDVLSGEASTEEALVEIGEGFGAIPGDPSIDGYASIETARLESVISDVSEAYDYVLLDTGAGLSYDDLLPLGLADTVILVTSPDPAAMENAKRTQAFVEKLNQEIHGVVVTKADRSVDGSIADSFGLDLLGVIPEDQAVKLSTAAGKPLEIYSPNSPAAQAYRQLEANLTDGVLPPQGMDSSSESPMEKESEDSEAPEEEAVEGEDEEEQKGDDEAVAVEEPSPGLFRRIVRRVT